MAAGSVLSLLSKTTMNKKHRKSSHHRKAISFSLNASPLERGVIPSFGIGIPCHNEAHNIRQLLENITHSWPAGLSPERIVVISSASTDGTDQCVKEFAMTSPVAITLQVENIRTGKSSAVNKIIQALSDLEIIILISADVLPNENCLMKLLYAFTNPKVGAAGGRPIPEGPEKNLTVKISRLLWNLHHYIAGISPKSTEITAFRNMGNSIDKNSLVDEAEIERMMNQEGYRVVYIPEATIRVKAPLSLKDYLVSRTRVTLGHILIAKKNNYYLGTLSIKKRLWAISKLWKEKGLSPLTLLIAAILETWIYFFAFYKSLFKPKVNGIWKMSKSAKHSFDGVRIED